MECCEPPSPSPDSGFLLVEAVVAVGLIALCAGAALAAVAAVTQAQAHALPASSLTLTAQNVLTDLRAATAYDPAQLAALDGQSLAFDADEPGPDGRARSVHIVVTVTHAAPAAPYVANITARAANGTTVAIAGTLVQEAPAPGAIVPASTPPPPDSAASGDSPTLTL